MGKWKKMRLVSKKTINIEIIIIVIVCIIYSVIIIH
jgi:hypothetical protein